MPNREGDERGITRRSLVTSIPVVGGGSLLGSTGLSNATGSNVGGKDTVPGPVRVAVDPSEDGSEWSVDERIFGKFFEQNGRDAYPGIYSDHVSNGSFEVWNDSGPRTSLLYDVEKHAGVAYGWEPIEAGDSGTFEQPRGGVHGREAEPDLESGDEVPGNSRPDPGGVDAARFQRIRVDGGRAGVEQRTALPDRRTKTFVVDVSVRGDTDACEVRLADDHGVHDSVRIPVTDQWERHGVELAFDRECRNRYRRTPFGECSIAFQVEGEGRVDLDRVVLRAGDAVRGKYNPTTIDRLRDCNVTSLRWGGNFNSQYHWRDGVGPQEDRPVVPNGAWGGLERNYLGTNEFLEFCELVGVEPLITVGTWTHIGPEEAADWVEYVNGDRSTEMGQLRAEHGYPEPWDVRAWQVGNEVWGHYQVGHQRAKPYARRYSRYYEAMKEADPVIEIDATGIDPGYTDYSDGALLPRNFGTPPTWNPILFGNAGEDLEGVDIHRYSGGLAGDTAREKWLRKHDCDPVRYNEMLVSFPRQFGDLVDDLRTRAAQRGVEDLRVTFGEWNLQPKVSDGWPRAGYPTMAHAAFVAGMFNTLIRQGDTVRQAHQRDNTLYHRPYVNDTRPVNPGNYVQKFYAEPFTDGREWHHVPADVDGPTFTLPSMGHRIRRTEDVPSLDATAVHSDDGETVVVYAVNRNLRTARDVEFDVADRPSERCEPAEVPLVLIAGKDDDPFARHTSWTETNGFVCREDTLRPDDDGLVRLSMPPASVVRLEFDRGVSRDAE